MKLPICKKAPTRQNDRNLSECKLLDSAQQMFMRMGFDASTTRMIASQAGVNLALISKYFGSKEGLLLALLEKRTFEFMNSSLTYPEQADLESELKAHYLYLSELHARAGAEMMKIVISKSLTDEEFCRETNKRLVHESKALVERLVSLQKNGLIRADVDVHDIEEQVRRYFQAQAFFGTILFSECGEKIKEKLARFASTMARAYAEVPKVS